MNKKLLLDNLRCIPDWPIKGVNFRDVTTLFKSPEALQEITDEMVDLYKGKGVTKIVGIESRGFVMSSAIATRLGAGIVLCRKPGKLPCETIQESYQKEYGVDTIEIHKDAIDENDVVLLHDDLLATGGTMKAACDLVKKFNPQKCIVISSSNSIRNFLTAVNSLIRILKLALCSNSNKQTVMRNVLPYPIYIRWKS